MPWVSPRPQVQYYFPIHAKRRIFSFLANALRPNTWPGKLYHLSLWTRPACETLPKVLGISSDTDWVAPDLWKTLVILSDTTVRRITVKRPLIGRWWVQISKNEKTLATNVHLGNRSMNLCMLLPICCFQDTLIINKWFCLL